MTPMLPTNEVVPQQFLVRIDKQLRLNLPQGEDVLSQAMRYAVLNGGKRIRGSLVHAAGQLGQPGCGDDLDKIACAVEFAHAYSLVHDDLPAMDNDAFRRGLPSCHSKFGEATAILAGDALQVLAFAALAGLKAPELTARALQVLTAALGVGGMAGGQSLDLQSISKALTQEQLDHMCWLKTGELIQSSLVLGALAGQCSESVMDALMRSAKALGLGYQIVDDLIDAEDDGESGNYVRVLGRDAAQQRADNLHREAEAALQGLPVDKSSDLLEIIRFLAGRWRRENHAGI